MIITAGWPEEQPCWPEPGQSRGRDFRHGQVEREPYDLLFGKRQAPDGTRLGRPPGGGRTAAGLYAQLLAAEPHATAERRRELRTEAARKARQGPLFFDLTLSSRSPGMRPVLPGPERLLRQFPLTFVSQTCWTGLDSGAPIGHVRGPDVQD